MEDEKDKIAEEIRSIADQLHLACEKAKQLGLYAEVIIYTDYNNKNIYTAHAPMYTPEVASKIVVRERIEI